MAVSCLWWTFGLYALIAFQVVSTGILHSNEEISNNQRQNHSADQRQNNAYIHQANDKKYINEHDKTIHYMDEKDNFGKPLKHHETFAFDHKHYDDSSKHYILENKFQNKQSYDGYKHGNQDEIDSENVMNGTEIQMHHKEDWMQNEKSEEFSSFGNKTLNNSNHNTEFENQILIRKLLNRDHTDELHEENDMFRVKKHNKREFIHPRNYKSEEDFRRPNYRYENNFNQGNKNKYYDINEDYFMYDDYWNENYERDDEIHRGNDDENDDDDYDNINIDDMEDDDVDDELYELLREEEEIKKKTYNSKKPQNKPAKNKNINDDALQIFTYFLESIITDKIQELEKANTETQILKTNPPKQKLVTKEQQKNTTKAEHIKENKDMTKKFDDEVYSEPVEQWRKARNANFPPFTYGNDENWDDYKIVSGCEKEYKRQAMLNRPFILIKCNEGFNDNMDEKKYPYEQVKNDVPSNNNDHQKPSSDDNNKMDDKKQKCCKKVQKVEEKKPDEDKGPCEQKKAYKRNADTSIPRSYFNEYNPPVNEFNPPNVFYHSDNNVDERDYGYSPNSPSENKTIRAKPINKEEATDNMGKIKIMKFNQNN